MSRRETWIVAAAVASIVIDAVVIVGFAASILWICFAGWLGVKRIFGRSVDRFALAVSLSVPLLVCLVDFVVQDQVDRDMQALRQSQSWRGAKRLDDLQVDARITWLTKTRLLWLIPDASGTKIEARAFPYSILRYDMNKGGKLKRPFN